MSTTPKMIRLGPRTLQIVEALRGQLADQYSSEAGLLSEATRRGMLLLAVEAWHNEAGQYGGYAAAELARVLKHELMSVFNFLLEHDELPAMLRVPALVAMPAPVSPAPPVPQASAPEEAPPIAIDATVIESVQHGGQDEDWDD